MENLNEFKRKCSQCGQEAIPMRCENSCKIGRMQCHGTGVVQIVLCLMKNNREFIPICYDCLVKDCIKSALKEKELDRKFKELKNE